MEYQTTKQAMTRSNIGIRAGVPVTGYGTVAPLAPQSACLLCPYSV